MIKFGAKFVINNACIVMAPVMWFISYIGFLVYWISSSAYIFSIGEVYHVKGYAVGSIKWDALTSVLFATNWINFFWQSAIFMCSLYFLIVCTCTLWYFEFNHGEKNGTLVITSFKWMWLKHMGTIVLSSFIIATTWVLQLLMTALIYVLKSEDKAGENQCAICIAKCCSCCLDCFEKCLTFISKQAYVEVVLRSCGFCSGACASMKIMMNHAMEFSLIHGTVECVTSIGVFAIAFICTLVVSLIIDHADDQEWILVETLSPKIFTLLITVTIVKLFTF